MSIHVPNAHARAACWCPDFHIDGFKRKSAETFRQWYIDRYHGSVFHDLGRFSVAPLCVFGGGSGCEYTVESRSQGGTYAVCPKCRQVILCGWNDATGLRPRACGCGQALAFNDYFQPVEAFTRQGKAVDPAKDPAVTVAELCGYYDEDGIPSSLITPCLAILHAKGLLKTGSHPDYGRFEVRSSGLESPELREAFQRERWTWIDPTTRRWNLKLTDRGRAMLDARDIPRQARAKSELNRLLTLALEQDGARLKAMAVSALGELLSR